MTLKSNFYRNALGALTLGSASLVQADTITIDFDHLVDGALVNNAYASQGIVFKDAKVFTEQSISNPPRDNHTNFILPERGYNEGGSFSVSFRDPYTGKDLIATSVSFQAFLGQIGDVHDTIGVTLYTLDRGSLWSGYETFYNSPASYSFNYEAGFTGFSVYDGGTNGFDNFSIELTTSPVPEPNAGLLLLAGLGLIGNGVRANKPDGPALGT